LQPYQIQGHADYIVHFHNGTNFWDRFDIEQLSADDLAMVLLSPKSGSKLKEPILFKKAKFFARNIAPDKPVPVQLSLLFPYQEPLKNLKPFPLSLDGVVTFDRKFTKVVFHADKASYGDNDFGKLDFVVSRGQNPWGLIGNFDLKANDLSQFRQILNWRIVPTSRNVAYINFSGKGRIAADFRYPDIVADGSKRLWYEGTAKLSNVYFDPGSVIAPINQFNGDVAFTAEKISMPVYWMHLLEMPVQSDMIFTYLPGSNPQFQFHTNANELDLAQVFMKRNKPSDPDIHPGDTLPGMRTVYMGDFQGQRVKYNKILLDEMKGQWKDKDRALGFSNITLKYHKGFYQDAGSWIDFRRADYIDFHFTGHFEDFPTRRMFEELFGYDFFVDGRATGQGNLSGRYIDNRLDYSSLNGYFKVQVVNGSLLGYNLGIRILQFLGFKIDSKKYGLDFEKGKAEVIIKNGVVYFDDLNIKSWNLEAHCAGKVDLVKHSVRLWVAAYPLEVLSTVTHPIPLIGGLINSTQKGLFGSYAKAEGPWDSVSISAYLPLAEKVPTAPPPPEFPLKPWQ
jgi:hypothetical protein